MKINSIKAAEWLANINQEGADDIQFAETMVMLYKIQQADTEEIDHINITAEDIKKFDIEGFTDWLKETLNEIINSDEVDSSAWWKSTFKDDLVKIKESMEE